MQERAPEHAQHPQAGRLDRTGQRAATRRPAAAFHQLPTLAGAPTPGDVPAAYSGDSAVPAPNGARDDTEQGDGHTQAPTLRSQTAPQRAPSPRSALPGLPGLLRDATTAVVAVALIALLDVAAGWTHPTS